MKRISLILLLLASNFILHAQSDTLSKSVFNEVEFELDDGHKWLVTEGMLKYLNESFELIDAAPSVHTFKTKQLAKKLLKLSDKLIDKCNMPGEGHREFHKWLVPYIDLLEALQNEEFPEDEEVLLLDLKYSVILWHTYFE